MLYMDMIDLITLIFGLKSLKRSHWVYYDVPEPESVAEHSFGLAFLTLVIDLPKEVDRLRLVKMAILHDVGEVIVGDFVYNQGAFFNQEKYLLKNKEEKKAVEDIFSAPSYAEAKQLVIEFLELKSEDAKILKALDMIEMLMQSTAYEKLVLPGSLDDFWVSAKRYLKSPWLLDHYDCLVTCREKGITKCHCLDLKVLGQANKLKKTIKSSWVLKDVKNPESVASHTFGLSLLSLLVQIPKNIDRNKLIKMAIVHETAKSISGDAVCEVGKFLNAEKCLLKVKTEKKALKVIFSSPEFDDLRKLSEEYLDQSNECARFLKQLDRLESVFQALSYEQGALSENLNSFWENAELHIKDSYLKEIYLQLLHKRPSNGTQSS